MSCMLVIIILGLVAMLENMLINYAGKVIKSLTTTNSHEKMNEVPQRAPFDTTYSRFALQLESRIEKMAKKMISNCAQWGTYNKPCPPIMSNQQRHYDRATSTRSQWGFFFQSD